MKLNEDEIIQVLNIIKQSDFGELQLEMGDLKLVVRKGNGVNPDQGGIAIAPASGNVISEKIATKAASQEVKSIPEIDDKPTGGVEEELIPIKAPLMGILYRQPEPGAPSYVEVGSYVEEDTTVCLIEVMKVFNACSSGVRGYIQKVCA